MSFMKSIIKWYSSLFLFEFQSNKLFVLQNKKFKEITLPSHLLANVNQCLRTREVEFNENKSSTRTKRESRIRRGEYHRNNDEDMKANLKELEANMIDIVSEKMEEMMDSYTAINKRMTALEEKLEKVADLLIQQATDVTPAGNSNDEGT